jgi:hypothetical protein
VSPHTVLDGFGVWVQALVPLQVFVVHFVFVHVRLVPSQTPPEQMSS